MTTANTNIDGPNSTRRRRQIKSLGLQLGIFVCGFAAFMSFVASAVTYAWDEESAQLAFGEIPARLEMAAAHGTLIISNSFANRELFGFVDRKISMEPAVTTDWNWSLPGLNFRRVNFTDDQPVWSLSFSFLLPCIVFAAAARLYLWRFRKVAAFHDSINLLPSA